MTQLHRLVVPTALEDQYLNLTAVNNVGLVVVPLGFAYNDAIHSL